MRKWKKKARPIGVYIFFISLSSSYYKTFFFITTIPATNIPKLTIHAVMTWNKESLRNRLQSLWIKYMQKQQNSVE